MGNSIIETPTDTIIAQRIGVVNFFSKFHSIACGDWPEGLRRKIYNACSSQQITNETNDETGLQECTGARILQKMLMIAEAVYNTDIYEDEEFQKLPLDNSFRLFKTIYHDVFVREGWIKHD